MNEKSEAVSATDGQSAGAAASEVQRILVTGSNARLQMFHGAVCSVANAIERRGQTLFYTVLDSDLGAVLNVARLAGVTVQQQAEQPPFWPVVVQGHSEPWAPLAG